MFKGVDEEKVKDWSFKKGAIAFQTYKKNLNKEYIKKGLTPNFMKHPKLRDHWNSFVQFKQSQKSANETQTNTDNAQKKKYFHRLGLGGYKKGIIKW